MSVPLKFAYYGDDFTGSSAVLEVLARAGVRALLFPDIPDKKGEALVNQYEAIGIAGTTRSMKREQVAHEADRIFSWFSRFDVDLFHYKICSTLDSSPDIGNIGVAVEIGQRYFRTSWVPMLVGTPLLRRWVAFSQLFAQDQDDIARIDRHSTMSRHPVTPMQEADIRLHLKKQTRQPVAGLTLPDLAASPEHRIRSMEALTAGSKSGILVFDTVDNEDLRRSGEVMLEMIRRYGPFVVGSTAVADAWVRTALGSSTASPVDPAIGRAEPMLVVAGSASPRTATQINHARNLGWDVFPMEPWNWFSPQDFDVLLGPVIRRAVKSLSAGKNVVMYACEGPEDPAIRKTLQAAEQASWDQPLRRIGELQGRALRSILEAHPIQRVCVAGGDTSGHVCRELDIVGLEYAASIDSGAPICRARSDHTFDGLEICLKGGQIGSERFFESVREGRRLE